MTIESETRTVHAVSKYGVEVVRYNRAGKWWIEDPVANVRRQVNLHEAMKFTVEFVRNNRGTWHKGLPGGTAFDAKVRRALHGG